jgi:Kef-type K+ transport system membrane component KefB
VELVVLNIAYSAGAFSPTLFTMLVLMALVTTMCTTPLLNLLKIRGVPDIIEQVS